MASIQILEISSTQIEDLPDDITVGIRGGQEDTTVTDPISFLKFFWSDWLVQTAKLFELTLNFLSDYEPPSASNGSDSSAS